VLAHVGWPTVGLAVVILIGRAIRDKDQTRRLIGLIVVLVAVVVGSVAICVELFGMQVPGFRVAAMTRAAAPVATASPRPAPPVAADPVATASPSASGVYPDESGQRARSVQQSRRAAAPPATRPARIRSGSPTPRVRASRSPGRWARAGLQRDVRSLQSGGPRLVTIWPWPRSRRHRTCRSVAAVRGSPARHDLAVAEIEAASNLQVRRRTSILPRYTCPALTATVTVPARCARLAVPGAIAEQLAHQQGGVIPVGGDRDRAPRLRTRGRPGPSRPVRPLSRSPGSPAQPSAHPPSPAVLAPGKSPGPAGRIYGNTPDSAAHVTPEPATGAARPWPSVESRRCTPTVPGAGRRPLYVRGRRDTAVHGGTR
jgi:hypothetical protein